MKLTYPKTIDTLSLSQDLLRQGGLIMRGVVLCTKCRKKMDKGVCECGNYKCLVNVYWHGKHYEYRRDNDSDILTYEKALKKLIDISSAIKSKTFNPLSFSDEAIAERKFEVQIEKWFAEKEKQESMTELSPGTVRQYRGYIRNYYFFFQGMDVKEITLEHLTNFKDTLHVIKIKTRKNIMIALHNFFCWLKERGVIKELPVFPKIKGDISNNRTSIDIDTQEEILQRIPGRHRDIIEFLMETGLRPNEVCALIVNDFDLKNRIARIEKGFVGNKLRNTNKEKRKRIIPLSDKAFEIVLKNMKGKILGEFLFINLTTKKHYTPNTLTKIWRKYSGVKITLYEGARHSFGSQLIQNGIDIAIVKELMGHSDIRTTQNYLHMRITNLSIAVNSRKVLRLVRTKIETK